jgi:hypothetical protein
MVFFNGVGGQPCLEWCAEPSRFIPASKTDHVAETEKDGHRICQAGLNDLQVCPQGKLGGNREVVKNLHDLFVSNFQGRCQGFLQIGARGQCRKEVDDSGFHVFLLSIPSIPRFIQPVPPRGST